jgi:hypothetical protein
MFAGIAERNVCMSLVEEAHWRAVDAMTPAQQLARMHAMNSWARWHIARRIMEQEGPLPHDAAPVLFTTPS